ncbi:hypothetical protein [Secundilactobacillus similis]|uniref:Uncharacterized protein n=1 Tax=Secundilactobacillus similis DSM 23365 = JCM 2765 TaxID=1423804 RepID=A0A0R2EWG6_9LACO|nr:hypothetical protein [Secundilactobacillus similis]KRN20625.1 hypothetical protein FD14_GL001411 [Secundilactobacillus similis DSM 23365 = JCM 2765]
MTDDEFKHELIYQLEGLNKTLSVIASNQERQMNIDAHEIAKEIQDDLSESLKRTTDQLRLSDY